MKRIALVRLDKIGDLVCTLPADQIPELQRTEIHWVIARGLGFVASHAAPGRRFLQLDKGKPLESFLAFWRFLRGQKFDAVVSFQAPWWVSAAAWLAGVPVRAGVRSQWHSFVFLNRGLRQRRSLARKHEADYNVELLCHALGVPAPAHAAVLKLHAPSLPDVFDRLGLSGGYVVVHPGMAGSALNWPQKHYVQLIHDLAAKHPVMITGTPADEPWLGEIRARLRATANVRWLVGELTPNELLATLAQARLVIAPSTGVAHLAASLERPVLCLFSPKRVQHPTRWAPRGPAVKILLPKLHPGEDAERFGAEIMERITPDDALAEAAPWL